MADAKTTEDLSAEDRAAADAAATAGAQPSEFEAAFAELQKAKQPVEAPPAVATVDDPDAAAPAAAPTATVDTPAPAAAVPAASEAPDIWATATPEQRAAFDAQKHKYASDIGRVTSYQREADRLRAENAALKAGKAAPGDIAPQKLADRPGIKKMVEDLPELAPVVEALEAITENQGHLGRAVKDVTDDRHRQAMDSEESAFAKAHPDFEGLRESGKFADWAKTKPKAIFDIAVRNGSGIVDSAEAIELVNMFKLESGIPLKPAAVAEPAPKPAAAASTNTADRRKAQLEAARSTPSSPGPEVANQPPDEFEAAFNQMRVRREKKVS